MKNLKFLIPVLFLFLISCDAIIRDKVYVEAVQDSDIDSYLYRITLESSNTTVYYYTDFKYQVGDSLLTNSQLSFKNSNVLDYSIKNNDSLKIENEKLNSKIEELTLINKLLLEIVK